MVFYKRALWEAYETDGDAVVLIDEIDKAPRDFPNDLCMSSISTVFRIRSILAIRSGRDQNGRRSLSPPAMRRRLPDAFLRRCIFHRSS